MAFAQSFSNHTVGKLFRGIISNLCDKKFEITLIHHPSSNYKAFWNDVVRDNIRHIDLVGSFDQQKEHLSALLLDTLIFPDVGMDGLNYCLAHCRFAPQQLTSWGHPDTTGIDTIDKFVSSSLIEPPDAQANYTEELVLFSGLPSYYDLYFEPLLNLREDFGFTNSINYMVACKLLQNTS